VQGRCSRPVEQPTRDGARSCPLGRGCSTDQAPRGPGWGAIRCGLCTQSTTGDEKCVVCSQQAYSYFGEGVHGDSGTDDDEGARGADTGTTALAARASGDPDVLNKLGEHLYGQHWAAKRRWRRFAQRGSRVKRFYKRCFGRPFQPGPRFLCENCAVNCDLDWRPGTALGKKAQVEGLLPRRERRNPHGVSGELLKCSICDSERHLRRRCPRYKGGRHGGGFPGDRPDSNARDLWMHFAAAVTKHCTGRARRTNVLPGRDSCGDPTSDHRSPQAWNKPDLYTFCGAGRSHSRGGDVPLHTDIGRRTANINDAGCAINTFAADRRRGHRRGCRSGQPGSVAAV